MISDIASLSGLILSKDNILILTHANPDGDTLGSGCALALALRSLGKRADVSNSEEIPEMYRFMTDLVPPAGLEPDFVVSVDVADVRLLGKKNEEKWAGKIDLSIDHHIPRTCVGKEQYVEPESASCAELIFLLLKEAEVKITKEIADCLFVGVSTDTGCFRFSNVTPRTHRIAGELIEAGADAAKINERFFETLTFGFLELQRRCIESLELFFDGKVSLFTVTRKMLEETGCGDEDLDPIVALSRRISGVSLGLTIKEKKEGGFKVSARSDENFDASSFCAAFGGGGHKRAAGCSFRVSLEEVKAALLLEAEKAFKKAEGE